MFWLSYKLCRIKKIIGERWHFKVTSQSSGEYFGKTAAA
jgi:hypothetical protein